MKRKLSTGQAFRIEHLALLIILLASAACKKHLTEPPSPPLIIQPSPCKLVDETKSYSGVYEHYWYTYGKDGKLDSIYYSEVPGTGYVAWCREDAGGFVWKSYKGTDGKTPDLYDYLYNTALQDSTTFPTDEETSFQLWDGINNPGYGYTFQYKSSGKLDGCQQTAPFVTGLLIGLGVEYTASGDIDNMVWNVTTGPRATSKLTVSGYDGHPSPYTGIAGWAFLNPTMGWTGSEYDPLLYALSPHNPTEAVYEGGTSKLTEKYSYEYNTQGFPTKRTAVRSDPAGNSVTFNHTYSYTCN